ncbi:hypothetical protein LIP_2522 [Limnochorda pilosa]|uniref:Uncharacterized protein n=1 Tax=Limnochorda pilosa TaxID=1555112 RepID=A0A0K2SMX0_LIMPI|nr:hypothetical protein LIP_2522 [Limnochorda pilosa]
MDVCEPLGPHPDRLAQEPLQGPGQRLLGRAVAGVRLDPGQLPEACQQAFRGPAPHQHPAVPADQRQDQLYLAHGGPPAGRRDPVDQARLPRPAEPLHGTRGAGGASARKTDPGSQLHDRLVPLSGRLPGDQPGGERVHRRPGTRRAGRRLQCGPPGEHPYGVAVHGR